MRRALSPIRPLGCALPGRASLLALLLALVLGGAAAVPAGAASDPDAGADDNVPQTLAADTADTTDADIGDDAEDSSTRLRASALRGRVSLSAKVSECETGRDAEDRAVEFTGSMPAISGAVRMAMRFDLYERRADDEDFVRRAVPTFGRWERSDKNVPGFVYDKRVEELDGASDYRAVVRFHWYDGHGRVVRSSKRTSYICRQPDPDAVAG